MTAPTDGPLAEVVEFKQRFGPQSSFTAAAAYRAIAALEQQNAELREQVKRLEWMLAQAVQQACWIRCDPDGRAYRDVVREGYLMQNLAAQFEKEQDG
uniref:Uncharacterized protein n=1 Tax=viral metagenome TaxID=1070528 RepID=A0A6M3JN76_9ZZZZ